MNGFIRNPLQSMLELSRRSLSTMASTARRSVQKAIRVYKQGHPNGQVECRKCLIYDSVLRSSLRSSEIRIRELPEVD
jgi:hypothetical protein